ATKIVSKEVSNTIVVLAVTIALDWTADDREIENRQEKLTLASILGQDETSQIKHNRGILHTVQTKINKEKNKDEILSIYTEAGGKSLINKITASRKRCKEEGRSILVLSEGNHAKITHKEEECIKQALWGVKYPKHVGTCDNEEYTKDASGGGKLIKQGRRRRICKEEECTKIDRGRGKCVMHGGINYKYICKESECTKIALRGGKCMKHGGWRSTCKEEECTKVAKGGGKCTKHGGIVYKFICKEEGCNKNVRVGGKCMNHGGSRRTCKEEECTKIARGGGKCIKHGGINYKYICRESECNRTALGGGKCIKHGGWRSTCKEEECTKIARGGGKCMKHGGRRSTCKEEACSKLAIGGGKCMKHGGRRSTCKEEACSKLAIGGGKCMKHGGTNYKIMCKEEECTKIARVGDILITNCTKSTANDYTCISSLGELYSNNVLGKSIVILLVMCGQSSLKYDL
ncbi:unnamed protein product, partial [Timema podura]|nr:unnamed protein product [Timema podura]